MCYENYLLESGKIKFLQSTYTIHYKQLVHKDNNGESFSITNKLDQKYSLLINGASARYCIEHVFHKNIVYNNASLKKS